MLGGDKISSDATVCVWAVLGVVVLLGLFIGWSFSGCGNPRIVLMYEDTAEVGIEKHFKIESGQQAVPAVVAPTPPVAVLP